MSIIASSDRLFKTLQSAITSKLRSVTQTDAIRQWEQDVRRYTLERLTQKAKTQGALADALKSIMGVDREGGVKLAILLEELAHFTGQLRPSGCKYPLRLMQAIMVKPMNVQAALDHVEACNLDKLSALQLYCVHALKAELLSATGKIQDAYALLKPLVIQKSQTMALRLSCNMRFAKLARTRNTLEAQSTLLATLEEIEASKPDATKWNREFAECAHELATLLLLCGQHQQALHWVQRALNVWQQLRQEHPQRIDIQLIQAGSLRTQALTLDEMGKTEDSQAALIQATKIVQQLVAKDPANDTLESELPKSHDVMGDIHMGNLDLDKALQEYSASAAIGAHLHFRDPWNIRWKLEEISSAMRIAQVLKKMARIDDALSMLATYRTGLETLIAQDPDNLEHRATIAQMLLQTGDLHWLQQDHTRADTEFREALAQLNVAIERDTHYPRWLLMHLMVMQRLAELAISKGLLDVAFNVLDKARHIVANAMSQDIHAKKLRQFFVAINTRLSDCAFDNGNTSIGMQVQEVTLQQATRYQQEHPESMPWLTLLCKIQTHAASHNLKLGLMQESRELWEKVIPCLTEKCEQHPENLEIADDLVRAQLVKVEWLCQQGLLLEAHRVSLVLLTQIRVSQQNLSDAKTRQSLLCECLEHFAFCCHHLNKCDQELAALKELERMRKDALQARPDSVVLQTQYYDLLLAMGRSALITDQFQQSTTYLNAALRGYNDLHEKQPHHPNYLLAIGDILVCLGKAYQNLNNAGASQLTLDKALQVAQWLSQLGSDSYVIQLAVAKILFAISQSRAYESQKMDLLKQAENQAQRLQHHLQNPVVNALIQDIAQQQAAA